MTDSGESKLPLQYEDGPDFCTVRDAQGRDFALTMQPDLMKAMEKALSDEIASFMRAPVKCSSAGNGDAGCGAAVITPWAVDEPANKPAIDPKKIAAIDDFLADGQRDRGYRAFAMMRHIWPQLRELALASSQLDEGSK